MTLMFGAVSCLACRVSLFLRKEEEKPASSVSKGQSSVPASLRCWKVGRAQADWQLLLAVGVSCNNCLLRIIFAPRELWAMVDGHAANGRAGVLAREIRAQNLQARMRRKRCCKLRFIVRVLILYRSSVCMPDENLMSAVSFVTRCRGACVTVLSLCVRCGRCHCMSFALLIVSLPVNLGVRRLIFKSIARDLRWLCVLRVCIPSHTRRPYVRGVILGWL